MTSTHYWRRKVLSTRVV